MFILLICWIGLGAVAGFAGSKLVKLGDDDPRIGSLIGGLAAVVGGGVYHFFAKTPPSATDYWSIVVAAGVGVMAVVIWFAIRMSASRA